MPEDCFYDARSMDRIRREETRTILRLDLILAMAFLGPFAPTGAKAFPATWLRLQSSYKRLPHAPPGQRAILIFERDHVQDENYFHAYQCVIDQKILEPA